MNDDLNDIKIDGDVEGGNVNIGGTQNFYGDVSIYQSLTKQALAKRKVRLFISYARADDEPFVERLYQDLKNEFDVWWDREKMSNRGKTFLQEIRDAIDWSDRLLLVAGPGAFTSDFVRDEWQYAYENYKGINIALRLGDYTDFPAQLSGYDAPDFRNDSDYDERLTTLKRQLAEPVVPIGAFRTVPALPPHFLNRPDALDALRQLVIADVDKPTPISAEKRITAIEGMGGMGKSVLATAFAYDRKVRFAFPDGIVWLKVGRTPNMYELYRQVGIALGDDLSKYPDEPTALQHAQNMLAGKKCLLILDDVWELAVGRDFRDLISGTLTRLLITTRDRKISDGLNANKYPPKLLDKTQAVNYLRSWIGDDPHLEMVAEKLRGLFLALNLAGRLMKENNLTGAEYLSMFERVSDMEIAPNREDSLEISINLSVDAAFANQDDKKLLYHTFGIFQEDAAVPQQTVLLLWSHLLPHARPIDHLKTLTTLVSLGLVERDEQKIITLHDLLHSYAHEKLGDRMMQTHQGLLDSYRRTQKGSGWHTAPNDGYLYDYLVYHLRGAGRGADVHTLFSIDAWMQARYKQSRYTYTGFLADLEVAWQTALEQDAISRTSISNSPIEILPKLIRYGLLGSTVVSLASNIVPELMVRAVETGVWEAERALRLAANVSHEQQRVEMYALLLRTGKLNEEQRERAQKQGLETALSVEHTLQFSDALKVIASELTGEQLGQMLNVLLLRITRDAKRELEILAPYLSVDQLKLAIDAIATLEPRDRQYYYETTEILNHQLKRRQETAEEIQAAEKKIEDEQKKKRAEQTMWLYEALIDSSKRREALRYLIPGAWGNEEWLLEALNRVMDAAKALEPETLKETPETLLDEFIRAVNELFAAKELSEILSREYEDEGYLAFRLKGIAPHLNGELLDRALVAAMAMQESVSRVEVIEALAPQMTETQLRKAMELALKFALEHERVYTLKPLASQLKGELMERAVEIFLAMENEDNAASGLKAVVPYLDEPLLERVFTAAVGMNLDQGGVMLLLYELVPRIYGELPNRVLQLALHLPERESRNLIALLAPNLSVDLVRQAVTEALVIHDEFRRVLLFADLAKQLIGEQREQLTAHAFGLALNVKSEGNGERTMGLMALADLLDETQLEMALDSVLSTKETWVRPQALLTMLPRLEGIALKRAVEALTDLIILMIDERDYASYGQLSDILSTAGQSLNGHHLERLLNTVINIDNEYDRATGLITLVPYMNDLWLHQTLQVAQEMRDDYAVSVTFAAQNYMSPENLSSKAIESALEAMEKEQEDYRGHGHAWRFAGPGRFPKSSLLDDDGLDEEMQQLDWFDRHQAQELRGLVLCVACPQLSGNLLERVLQVALSIEDEETWVNTVCGIVPCLDDERRHEVITLIGDRLLEVVRSDEFGLSKPTTLHKPRVTETSLAAYLDIAARYTNEGHQSVRQRILNQFFEVALQKPDENDLVNILNELAPYVDGELLERVLTRVLEIEGYGNRALMLSALASGRSDWVCSKADALFPQLAEVLHETSKYQRDNFVFILRELLPFWSPLVHDEGVSKIGQTLIEVCEKWEWL